MDIINPYRYSSRGGSLPSGDLGVNLRHCWEMDETGGTICYDSVSTLDGNIGTTPIINQTGIINKSYKYSGIKETDYVEFATSVSWRDQSNFSLSTWFYIDQLATPSSGGGIFCDWWGPPYRGVLLRHSNSSLQYYTHTGVQAGGAFDSVIANQWYHVVLTYDGSIMKLYKNTILSSITFAQFGLLGEARGSYNKVYIGSYKGKFPPPSVYPFNGKIDQTAIWNKILTENDINTLWNGGLGLPYSSW